MLEEYMQNIGYTEEQREFIMSSYPINTYTETNLLYSLKNIVNFLHRNGMDNTAIIKVTTTTPNVVIMSIENIKDKVRELSHYNFTKMESFQMIENYPYLLDMSPQRIHNRYLLFEELGFSKEDCNDLFLKKTDLFNKDPSSLRKRYDYFLDYGYDESDLTTILREVPDLLDMNLLTLNKKLDMYKEYGFTKDEIIKITSYLPELYIYTKEDIDQKTKYLKENGYTSKNIIDTIKKLPIILKHNNLERLEDNIDNLDSLGFGKSEIVPLTEKNPYILLYSKDIISENFKNFIRCGYTNTEVIKMMNETPLLLTYSSMELRERLEYYDEKNLLDIIKQNSSFLLISLDFIKKREKYIKGKHLEDLFLTDTQFEEKYGVTKDLIVRGLK